MNSNNETQPTEPHWGCSRRRLWKFPLIVAVVLLIKSGLVLLIWNNLIPAVFHGPELTFLNALELTVLVKLLVGFGGHHHRHARNHFRAHWGSLSDEEKAKLRETMRHRCGPPKAE